MQQYTFNDVDLLINNVKITGFDEGDDVITARRLNDNSSHIISADGIMTVSFSPDRSGEVIFRLNQASKANGYLSALVGLQEGNALVALTVDILSVGGEKIGGTTGYIPKPADVVRGVKTQAQEWRIVVENLNMLHVPDGKTLGDVELLV